MQAVLNNCISHKVRLAQWRYFAAMPLVFMNTWAAPLQGQRQRQQYGSGVMQTIPTPKWKTLDWSLSQSRVSRWSMRNVQALRLTSVTKELLAFTLKGVAWQIEADRWKVRLLSLYVSCRDVSVWNSACPGDARRAGGRAEKGAPWQMSWDVLSKGWIDLCITNTSEMDTLLERKVYCPAPFRSTSTWWNRSILSVTARD